jgi:(2Fe-2S) ferredoxin
METRLLQARPRQAPLVQAHLLLCATPTKALCCDPVAGGASWQRLKELVRELDLENPSRGEGIVLRSKVDCLRVCQGGPILLIWPDGITYGGVTPERLERILREHVLGGLPIQEWIIARQTLGPIQGEPQTSGPQVAPL